MTPLVKEVHKLTRSAVEQSMWFDMGPVDSYATDPANCPPLRLPFDRCAVVCIDTKHNKHLCLFVQVAPDVVTAVHYVLMPADWRRTELFAITMHDGRFVVMQVDGQELPSERSVVPSIALLQEWLALLQVHACNAYEPIIQATFTNRRKVAEGKPPSYSWNTVVVPAMPRTISALGGTHASPRLHERRGHWRTLESGRKVWVRECLVGDPHLGVIEKDYKLIRGASSPAAAACTASTPASSGAA